MSAKKKEILETPEIIADKKFNNDAIIERENFVLNFVKPDDESKKNDLMNSGKVIGSVAIDCNTANDGIDELLIIVKK